MTIITDHSSRRSEPHELEGAVGLDDQTVRVPLSTRGVSAGPFDGAPDDSPEDPLDEPPEKPPDSTGAGLGGGGGGGGESLTGSRRGSDAATGGGRSNERCGGCWGCCGS